MRLNFFSALHSAPAPAPAPALGPTVARHIVSPGFAKSGTTLLHYLFMNGTPLAGPKVGKELDVFRKEWSGDYDSLFSIGENKVATFEFSPAYLTVGSRKLRNDLFGRVREHAKDPLILLCIRHPLYRAISHYCHLLQDYSRFGNNRYSRANRVMSDIYYADFEAALAADPAISADVAETLDYLVQSFGAENVVLFFLETDGKDVSGFAQRLSQVLDADLSAIASETPPIVHQGKRMPQYFYWETGAEKLEVDGQSFTMPAGSLYIANDHGHEILPSIDPMVARRLLAASRLWTTEYDADLLERIRREYLAASLDRLDASIARTADAARAPKYADMAIVPKSLERVPFDAELLANELKPAA